MYRHLYKLRAPRFSFPDPSPKRFIPSRLYTAVHPSPSIMSTETVLVVGASGNIGASAVTAALRSGRKVLAVVRNHDSAEKLIKHVGSSQGITFVDADVMKDTGVQGVVDQVREGTLPAFQHVYSCGSLLS